MHESIQAVWFEAPQQAHLRSEQLAPLAADEVRIRAVYSAISHGTEMLVYRGQVPADLGLDLPTLQGSFAFPIKYGYALVGHVEACGTHVHDIAVGERVFALHPHQTVCHVPQALVKPIPVQVDLQAAVLAANMETAVNIVLDVAPVLGERIVLTGLGVVGLLVAWILQQHPIELVVADINPRRRELAQQLGCRVVCHPDQMGAYGDYDAAVEVSGNPRALESIMPHMAREGRIVVASWYGTKPVVLDLGSRFHRQRLRMVSSQVGHIPAALTARWDTHRRMQVVWQLLAQLPYQRLISHTMPFAQASDVYSLIDTAPEAVLQVVLQYPKKERSQ